MQSLKKFYFGKQKVKVPNTFIGGIGGTINTPALLAAKLGISENRIKLFKVTGVDVECAVIGGGYTPPIRSFVGSTEITYFDDKDGLITTLPHEFIIGSFNPDTFPLKWTNFPKATSTNNNFAYHKYADLCILPNCVSVVGSEWAYSYYKRIYIPKCTSLGIGVTASNVFLSMYSTPTIYVNPILQTNNSGQPDGDLQYAISRGATIRYITNFTPPNPVTNLSTGTIYNTAVQLNFTPPTSVNGVDFYECYANGKLMNEIKNSGGFITGLTPSTNYNIRIVAVDMFYNKSELSNTVNVSTTNRVATDVDAISYINASSNTIFQDIIDDMFIGFKTQGLYAKTPAFYPFLGTTAAQHKWNAKNPLDTNAAFRLQFFGGGTHSNLGYQCNGTDAYANTFLVPSLVQNVNSNGLTVVVGTNFIPTASCVEIASYNSETQMSYLQVKDNPTNERHAAIFNNRTGQAISVTGAKDAKGIYTGVKTSATINKLFKNKTLVISGTGGGSLPSNPFGIGAFYNGAAYSPQRIQFVAIHEGLTDAEVVALHTIIDNFETAIGRKTW